MAAYNSISGIPSSSNRWLLTDVLTGEWGFDGFVVSDYGSVWGLQGAHRVAETRAEAGKLALEAGLDVELPHAVCFPELVKMIKEGKVSEDTLDKAVERVLKGKYWLGLFDNPFADPDTARQICDCDEHRELALKVAERCIVLLKNDGILPLPKDIGSLAVIGPNANEARLGGYSGYDMKVVTPLEGISNKVAKGTKVYFAEGCKVRDYSKKGFPKAIAAASRADVAILVMGNSDETEGEGRDRCNLDLGGVQEELIKAIVDSGTPVVVVLINGSAVTMSNWIDLVDAVVEAWYPGEEGGNAIANVLFGDYNPGGKLPITFPRYTGQVPLYYNHMPCIRSLDYVEARGRQPLFPFGYGLSYTTFHYKDLKVTPRKAAIGEEIKISVEVENRGNYEGDEVVQLYIRDKFSRMVRPVLELKRFQRIHLIPGEKARVEFVLKEEDLSFLDEKLVPLLEPGAFEVLVGGDSERGLKAAFEVK